MAKSLGTILNPISKHGMSQLNVAVREAERVVGYSTSFLNLRWLLSDEFANIALQIRKLVGTKHPLLHTAKKLLLENNIPNWGMIVLLISKAAGLNSYKDDLNTDRTAGVLNTQRILAEVTEMIRMSKLIHNSIIDAHNIDYTAELHFGNRIALLSGDYLLSNCFNELAKIGNNDVSLLMSSSLRDFAEFEFLDSKPQKPNATSSADVQEILKGDALYIDAVYGSPRSEWLYRSVLGGASLLAKSCSCALKLADHPRSTQQLGYAIGVNIALAMQISAEREAFMSGKNKLSYSLVSAPVMLHLEQEPNLYDWIVTDPIDRFELRKRIFCGGSLDATKQLQNDFCDNALKALNGLPACDARTALVNIVKTIE